MTCCIIRDSVGSPDSTSTELRMTKTNQMPSSTTPKERRYNIWKARACGAVR